VLKSGAKIRREILPCLTIFGDAGITKNGETNLKKNAMDGFTAFAMTKYMVGVAMRSRSTLLICMKG